jgi:putative flippase GtrA
MKKRAGRRVPVEQKIANRIRQNPRLGRLLREGGLFVLVSNAITVLKALALLVLPEVFAFLGSRDFGFPGLGLELFGVPFRWYIIGYSAEAGGLAYFTAYVTAMVAGEVVNFFLQRRLVFRSHGNILVQAVWYTAAFCVVTCVVNSVNCVWVDVVKYLLPDSLSWLHSIGTTVLNGGISMCIFFVVNKIVFEKRRE